MGQSDSLGLGDKTEEMTVPVNGPGESMLNYLETGLVVSVEESSADEARMWRHVGELDGGVAKPLNADDLY